MHYTLGADETKPGALFLRLINPTELDKTAVEMARLIKSYYPGWDLANMDLWRKLGWDVGSQGNPLQVFLQSYIQLSREERKGFRQADVDWWINTMHTRFAIRVDDLEDYFRAMNDMVRAGTMSETILYPYTYEPTEIGEDIAKATKSVLPKAVAIGAIFLGVAVFANSAIPQITKGISAARSARARRRTASAARSTA